MPRRNYLVASLFLAFLALGWVSTVQAAPVGTFLQVEGQVDLMKGGKLPATTVKAQDGVEVGDVVRTKSQSRAQIKFVDDTVLTLAPESRVTVEEYMFDGAKGDRKAVLGVLRGLVHTAVEKVYPKAEPDFIMKTHTAVLGVRGTKWYTKLLPNATDIYTEGTKLEVKNLLSEYPGVQLMGNLQHVRVGAFMNPTVAVNITREDLKPLEKEMKLGLGSTSQTDTGPLGPLGLLGPPQPQELFGMRTLVENIHSGLYVPHYDSPRPTDVMEPGMTFTIEPMITLGPGRIVSARSPVDNESIRKRPCFLCLHNLPPEQRALQYRNEWLILNNPAPLFPDHLVISHREHSPQLIRNALPAMIALVADLECRFSAFYNGPACGASAPDHLHFQLSPERAIPLVEQLAALVTEDAGQEMLTKLNSSREGSYYTGYIDYRSIFFCMTKSPHYLLERLSRALRPWPPPCRHVGGRRVGGVPGDRRSGGLPHLTGTQRSHRHPREHRLHPRAHRARERRWAIHREDQRGARDHPGILARHHEGHPAAGGSNSERPVTPVTKESLGT